MLCYPWGSCLRLHSQVLWGSCPVKSTTTSSSEPSLPHRTWWHFCICLILDIPTHYRFLVFLLTGPDFYGWGRKLEKEACIDHMACDWSLCFGNLQFFRNWRVLSGVFSVPFCYTCGFFFFNKTWHPLKILWLCLHFPSPSICLCRFTTLSIFHSFTPWLCRLCLTLSSQ